MKTVAHLGRISSIGAILAVCMTIAPAPVLGAVQQVVDKGPPVWSVPNLEFIFCPLRPKEPCQGLTVLLTVNIAEGNYTVTGGDDIMCRSILQAERFNSDWHKCENPKLQWRWEFENMTSSPWFWPQTEDGWSSIGIRYVDAPYVAEDRNVTDVDGSIEMKKREISLTNSWRHLDFAQPTLPSSLVEERMR
jgi:hypothetical protein